MTVELPRATADRAYLLAWHVEKKRLIGWSHRGQVMNAAAMIDLWHAGRLVEEGKGGYGFSTKAVARPARGATGGHPGGHSGGHPVDGVEALVLARIAAAPAPKRWKHWIGKADRVTENAVRERLAQARVIKSEERRTLGFRWHKVTVRDSRVVRELVSRCRRAVLDGVPPERVDRDDAALVALVAAAEWNTVFSGKERREHRDRIKALAVRSGPAAKALRDAINDSNAASAAA